MGKLARYRWKPNRHTVEKHVERDLPPDTKDDMPRKLKRLFVAKKLNDARHEKKAKDTLVVEKPTSTPLAALSIKDGETMRHFYERVETEARHDIASAAQKKGNRSEKRKLKLKERKETKKRKQQPLMAEENKFDHVKHGEVVQAPPKLSHLPRKASAISKPKSEAVASLHSVQALAEAREKAIQLYRLRKQQRTTPFPADLRESHD